MMQQVATAKSELAAFAIGAETSGQQESATKEQFGLLLKDQQNSHNQNDKSFSSTKALASKDATSSVDNATQTSQVSHKKDISKGDAPAEDKAKKLVKDKSATDENKEIASLNNATVKETSELEGSEAIRVETLEKGERDVLPRDSDINFYKFSKPSEITLESEVDSEFENIDLQEWVNLVDNLKGLNQHQSDLSLDFERKADPALGETLLDTFDSKSDASLVSHEVESSESLDVESLETSDLTSLETSDVDMSPSQSIADKIFHQLDQVSNKEDLRKLVAEILTSSRDDKAVDLPLNGSGNQDKTLDTLATKISENIDEQGIPDLTKEINKSLLIELLGEADQDISEEVLDSEELAIDPLLVPTSDIKDIVVSDAEIMSEEPVEVFAELSDESTNDLVNKELEEVIEIQPLVNTLVAPVESKKYDLKGLIDLPSGKLDKVLENISARVIDSKQVSENTLTEQNLLAAERATNELTTGVVAPNDIANKEFVAALKSGLQEFKSQLSQGREPGLDLKALVAEAATKVTDQSVVNKAAISSDLTASSVSQVIDFASTLSQAVEHNHTQTYNNYSRDVAQIQGEQSKQTQLNQLDTKYDKAINITKPEGHQQLAEKVRWMVNTKNLVADIRLDPAELGSVHVKVAVTGESATVNFVVQSHHARDAVDSATPRLREMLAEKGIELGQSSVRQDNSGQQQEQGEFSGNSGSPQDGIEEVEVPENMLSQQNVVNGALGGIDYFV